MDSGTITEAQFLLTELQYTLGQLHVQLADLDAEALKRGRCGDRTIEQVLTDLNDSEAAYQAQYARILGVAAPAESAESHVALPVADDVGDDSWQANFERRRTQTIDLLTGRDADWTQELLDLVKQQVSEDRKQTTQIADCRKTLFEGDARADLDEPLTTSPVPHQFAEETGSHVEPGDGSVGKSAV